ncbi:osmoprotectant transport system permease protein [Modestobacter sp. DSM 44400]|uniref:ABC transporter permease n=1 Tax=Modestobacter sp. DSM 44400 TaxID=1550230 RepID=UPI00089569A2|nr:ABC transporter permease [Modestobacter sp. DSM 44400]SDY18629.1 osmoprotectant transport system permease protein [Modestobacter sp. DSM 44400]
MTAPMPAGAQAYPETETDDPQAAVQTRSRARSASGRGGWRGLLVQPVLIAAGTLAFVLWRATAELSDTETRQLGWSALGRNIVDHLQLTLVAGVLVLAIGIPLGVLLTRGPFRRATPLVLAVANTGQAAPAIGLFVLLATWLGFGFGFRSAVVALVLYTVLPVLRNTMVGLEGVDARLVEAGRGMGMSALAVLFRVELPLAVPVMLAGVRTALVLLVGTATLATFISGGGLGLLITTGVNLSLDALLVSGAVLVALLALAVDWVGRVIEHLARPKGL